MIQKKFMKEALAEAYTGIRAGDGGPFGSVIVRDGKIIGRGHNRVLLHHDPTCHGEMEAIRDACKNLGSYDLTGCELYTTAEPCPMCLGGILWANISCVYYGCNRSDTDGIGFRDNKFFQYLQGDSKLLDMAECDRDSCLELFREYAEDTQKQRY